MGLLLYADYRLNPNRLVDRVMAAEIIAQEVERLAQEKRLMIAGGNAYVLPYAEVLVEAPSLPAAQQLCIRPYPSIPWW